MTTGAVEVGEDHFGRDTLQQRGLQKQGFEPLDIACVHFGTEHDDLAALALGHRIVALAGDGIHLVDDGRGVRLDDLRAVVEVGFEAVVVRRVVTRGEHHARIGAKLAHGEGKLRRRAWTFKEISIATEIGCNLRAELGEVA